MWQPSKTSTRSSLSKPTVSLLILLLLPRPSSATPANDPTPLGEGAPAPFSGILLPTEDAAALWKKLEFLEGKLALQEKHCSEQRGIDNDKCFQQLSALKRTRDEQVAVWKAALVRCELEKERAWYENPGLLLGTGTVIGAALGIGVIWLGAQFKP